MQLKPSLTFIHIWRWPDLLSLGTARKKTLVLILLVPPINYCIQCQWKDREHLQTAHLYIFITLIISGLRVSGFRWLFFPHLVFHHSHCLLGIGWKERHFSIELPNEIIALAGDGKELSGSGGWGVIAAYYVRETGWQYSGLGAKFMLKLCSNYRIPPPPKKKTPGYHCTNKNQIWTNLRALNLSQENGMGKK